MQQHHSRVRAQLLERMQRHRHAALFRESLARPDTDGTLRNMNEAKLRGRLVARGIDLRAIDAGDIEANLAEARQKVTIKQGIEQAAAKKLIAELKAAKLKVDAQINGEKIRVNGKKRDDLQAAIALLKNSEVELPLQFDNFRD